MVDETQDNGVVAGTTDAVDEAVKGVKRASAEDILALPALRIAQAKPFVIPGTGLEVMVAACSGTDAYRHTVAGLCAVKAEGDEKKVAAMKVVGNAIIKSCVVDPELTDEAIQALNEYSANGLGALLEFCKTISGLGDLYRTADFEDFT